MNRFLSSLACLLLLVIPATSAGEREPSRRFEDGLKLQAYVRCDGFAGGVRGVILDRRPQTAEAWREVDLSGKKQRVSVIDGYRVMYSYARTYPFANLKAERSDASRYIEDKGIVALNLVEMAKADVALDLVNFSHGDFSGQALTKRELVGRALGMVQIFSDEDSVIVTVYFLNQAPENRRFQTHEEFVSLRDSFLHGYIECVARKRSASVRNQ